MIGRPILLSLLLLAVCFAQHKVAASDGAEKFLATYCTSCHGEEKQKGDRRFDEFSFPIRGEHAVLEIQDIIDQLTLGDMPPKKAENQPTAAEKAAIIESLTASLKVARAELSSTGGQTVLRRLNRWY